MKKLFKYLTLLIALGLSLVVLVACSNDKETPADTDPQQTVGNFETIASNEIDELEDSVERISEEVGTAKDQDAAKLANELNHIKMHLETLQENVNTGYDEHAVTEANMMDINGRIDDAKATIDDLVKELTEKAGSYASEISADSSAPIENVKTKEGLEKVVKNYTDNLDGIEQVVKDDTANKEKAKEYIEDMKAHIAYVTQIMDGLVSDKAISEDDKATFTKEFDELNSRIDTLEKELS